MLNILNSFSSFSVDDINKAKAFYETILGLKTSDNMGGLNLELKDGPVFVYPKPNHVPATFTVLNFVVENLESTVDELTNAGVVFEKYSEGQLKTNEKGITVENEPTMTWFKDPAGNFLSIIQK